jgi:hypothetical protein
MSSINGSTSGPKLRICKYGCNSQLIWDDDNHCFRNFANGERHSCPNYPRRGQSTGGYPQTQQQESTSTRTSETAAFREGDISTWGDTDNGTSHSINGMILDALKEISDSHSKFGDSMTKLEKAIEVFTKSVSESVAIARRFTGNQIQETTIPSIVPELTEEKEWKQASTAKKQQDQIGQRLE